MMKFFNFSSNKTIDMVVKCLSKNSPDKLTPCITFSDFSNLINLNYHAVKILFYGITKNNDKMTEKQLYKFLNTIYYGSEESIINFLFTSLSSSHFDTLIFKTLFICFLNSFPGKLINNYFVKEKTDPTFFKYYTNHCLYEDFFGDKESINKKEFTEWYYNYKWIMSCLKDSISIPFLKNCFKKKFYVFSIIPGILVKRYYVIINDFMYIYKKDIDNPCKVIYLKNMNLSIENFKNGYTELLLTGYNVIQEIIIHNDDYSDYKKEINSIKEHVLRKLNDYWTFDQNLYKNASSIIDIYYNNLKERAIVKKILKSNNLEEDEEKRNEIIALKMCNHPNVIKIYDTFEDNNYFYIVMEKMDTDLYTVLKGKSTLSEKSVKKIAKILYNTLAYLHSIGICHRDLKPENILVTYNLSEIKIGDFGLCSVATVGTFFKRIVGTNGYISPDIITYGYNNHSTDIWSLGVIIFLLKFGHLPYDLNLIDLAVEVKNKITVPPCTSEFKSFIESVLDPNIHTRINAENALKHVFMI